MALCTPNQFPDKIGIYDLDFLRENLAPSATPQIRKSYPAVTGLGDRNELPKECRWEAGRVSIAFRLALLSFRPLIAHLSSSVVSNVATYFYLFNSV
jgi:hypothetical protein